MQQLLCIISIGSFRHPIMPLKKQQHVNYTTWWSDFESCRWILVSALNSYYYRISCIAVIFACQILLSLIHYSTTLTIHREPDKTSLRHFLAVAVTPLLQNTLEKIFCFAEKFCTLIFLSSRSPVRKKESSIEIRPGWVTHVKWSCKSLRKSLPLNCLLSSTICTSLPFRVT